MTKKIYPPGTRVADIFKELEDVITYSIMPLNIYQEEVFEYLEYIGYVEYITDYAAEDVARSINAACVSCKGQGLSPRMTACIIFGLTWTIQLKHLADNSVKH